MGEWSIYGSDGSVKAVVKKLEYSGEFMGETIVTCDVYSPSPINFDVGDYLSYRGETFAIDYNATRKKQAKVNTYGKGFVYEGMRFISYIGELKKCGFLDFVPSDNQVHYSQLPEFSFFAENVSDLAERIKSNLDRLYTGGKTWTVSVAQRFSGKENINVQVSKISCFDALKLAYDQFEAQFVIRGREITIGTAGNELETNYTYGKGNGLKTIERSVEESDTLITRLRAYGNTTNMPANYYRNKGTYVYAPISSVFGIYEQGADIHFVPKFSNSWFTEKSGNSNYWVDVSLDKKLWVKGVVSTNVGNGNVDFSVVSTSMYEGMTQEMVDAFNGQLRNAVSGTYLYFRRGIDADNWNSSWKEGGDSGMPDLLSINRLMLPSFLTEVGGQLVTDPYIDSSNISELGIREMSVYFDGSDPELPDIHPSLEGMTARDIDPSGSSSDYLDEIAAAATEEDGSEITTDGTFVDTDKVPGFKVRIKDIGFDINSYLSGDTATLSMKSGMCGGREFTITKVEEVSGGYMLHCQRTEDIGLYFPYKSYPISAGDKFVLTNIEMPDVYITAAANRLQDAAEEYLSKHSQPQYVYAIKMDDIWMQRQADGCESVGDSYYWNIKEGDVMQVQDNDLGIYEGTAQNPTPISEVIDRLTIREGYSTVPEIEVVLRKEKPQGTIGVLLNRVKQLEQINSEQLRTINRQAEYITLVLGDRINDIANQADHQQVTYFGTETPTLNNYPYTDWYNQSQHIDNREIHIGDMYYDKTNHRGYLFEKNGNTYVWTLITDEHTLEALEIASQEQDTIDGKRRVFVGEQSSPTYLPTPPYDTGDLWVNATYPNNNTETNPSQNRYYNDILKCIKVREEGDEAAITDWTLASKYTDDSLAQYVKTYAENIKTLEGNLLLNSGFTGEYESEATSETLDVNAGMQMYSDPLRFWDNESTTVVDNSDTVTGKAASLSSGRIRQSLGFMKAGSYVLSFKAIATQLSFDFCGQVTAVDKSSSMNRHDFHLEIEEGGVLGYLEFSGTAVIGDVMLTFGTLIREWQPSEEDNNRANAEIMQLDYLQNAISKASTKVLGGLVLTQMIKVGNYRMGNSGEYEMSEETGGLSGLVNDIHSPFTWGGGSLAQALYTINKYKADPSYQATEQEIRNMAQYVVTHGGRAILNDVILRGYIYAQGGIFNGIVKANMFYSPVLVLGGTGTSVYYYVIDPQNEPYNTFLLKPVRQQEEGIVPIFNIDLPNPNSYDGLELNFYKESNPLSVLTNHTINAPTGSVILIPDDSYIKTNEVSSVTVKAGTMYTFKSMRYTSNANAWFLIRGNVYGYLPDSGGTVNGDIDCLDIDARDVVAKTLSTHDNLGNTGATIDDDGDIECNDIYADNVEIYSGEVRSHSGALKLQDTTNGDIEMCNGNENSSAQVKIFGGNGDNKSALVVSGGFIDCSYKVKGTRFENSSDKRKKIERGDVSLTLEQISNAPSKTFNWKKYPNGKIQGGTYAQYWEDKAPWAVDKDSDGYLTVEYGTLSLASVIALAREVKELKSTVERQESRIKELEKQIFDKKG